jgi:hypothetical protein
MSRKVQQLPRKGQRLWFHSTYNYLHGDHHEKLKKLEQTFKMLPDSVGTRYGPGVPGNRIPVEGENLRPQPHRPWGPSSLICMRTVSSLWVKRLERGTGHPPHLVTRLKKEYSYTFTPSLCFQGMLQRELYICPKILAGSLTSFQEQKFS